MHQAESGLGGRKEASAVAAIAIRQTTIDDAAVIWQFIQQKAAFDREIGAFTGTVQTSVEKLQHTLFGDHPLAYALLAEDGDRAVGFALYYFRYSSFAGQPSLWLDDLFVDPAHRSQGVGAALMAHLAAIAQTHNCTHLAWTADARNIRGLSFYNRLGASITHQHGTACLLKWIPPNFATNHYEG